MHELYILGLQWCQDGVREESDLSGPHFCYFRDANDLILRRDIEKGHTILR